MAKEDHVGRSAGDQEVRAHVELPPVQQQRLLDVTERNDMAVSGSGGESACVSRNGYDKE